MSVGRERLPAQVGRRFHTSGSDSISQTIRQLLPAEVEAGETGSCGEISIPAVQMVDRPRLSSRGITLDWTAKTHSAEDVMRLIDRMSTYKLNTLGWCPGEAGFESEERRKLEGYAQDHFITLVPEFRGFTDLTDSTALAAHAERVWAAED